MNCTEVIMSRDLPILNVMGNLECATSHWILMQQLLQSQINNVATMNILHDFHLQLKMRLCNRN